jgi:ribosomal protein S8
MLKIKSPNFIFGAFFCSLKNAILKRQSSFTTYISKFTLLVTYFFLKKRYFSNAEIYQIDPSMKKKGYVIYIVINYSEEESSFNNVFLLYSRKNMKSISVKRLQSLTRIERVIYVLSTSQGILNTSESIIKNVGGIALLEIF